MKTRKAFINMLGKEPFILPIVEEGSHGFLCRTSPNDGPATEWFPFNSNNTTCHEIQDN